MRSLGSFLLRPLNTALGKSLGCAEIDLGTLETNPCLWLHWHTAHTVLSDTNLIYTTPTLALLFFFFFTLWLISHLMPSAIKYKRFVRFNPVPGL